MELYFSPHPEWKRLTEDEAPPLKEFLENVRFFKHSPFTPEEGVFPKPAVLTLVAASQINLLWIPNFTE